MTRPLRATYRLQLNHTFRLDDARRIVPYLDRLGVSHAYLSPVLAARRGSMHGYDVVDPTRVNPELGTERDFRALVRALHDRDMGVVLDIVPNHMGTGPENRYWEDVLANGRNSEFAHWFDIDWESPDPVLRGRVMLPVLGGDLDEVISRRELSIARDENGPPRLRYFEQSFPIAEGTLPESKRLTAAQLTQVVERQHYRLSNWRAAAEAINYRRFFDVNDLVALRMDDERVFEAVHETVLSWASEGLLDAVRIDHVDGLAGPRAYLERLRRSLDERTGPGAVRIVVEKILSPGEKLRSSWPIDGTTGYEAIADTDNVLLEPAGVATLERGYRAALRGRARPSSFLQAVADGKREVLRGALQADVRRLARLAAAAAGKGVQRSRLARAIVELIVALPVYRTYLTATDRDEEDVALVRRAMAGARASRAVSADALGALREMLLGRSTSADRLRVVRRLQQTSGPATAKGVEDTALYRWVPLASRNEVGGDPDRPVTDAVERFHAANVERATNWPRALVTATTHDTKRAADVRARIAVLSEIAEEWTSLTNGWRRRHRALKGRSGSRRVPDANTEWLLYQTIYGVWPTEGELTPAGWPAIADRVSEYLTKAVREAKDRTRWTDPDQEFERLLDRFVRTMLEEPAGREFRAEMSDLVRRTAGVAVTNALSRTLLHFAGSGVPDLHQGDESWLSALVDPDNRRPVDFGERSRLLAAMPATANPDFVTDLLRGWPDARCKLWLVHRALRARREQPAAFLGEYRPLSSHGIHAPSVVAFARGRSDMAAITIAPVRTMSVGESTERPLLGGVWQNTEIELPRDLLGRRWRCAISGHEVTAVSRRSARLAVGEALAHFPAALLLSGS